MELPQPEVNERLAHLLNRVISLYQDNRLIKENENFWAARAALNFNQPGRTDRGIFSIYLFNLVYLNPGEAIFQGAGIPHAYLEGQNMEIMANSDNVLRGGLTNKHVDVDELMKNIRFQPTVPEIIKAKEYLPPEETYPTSAADFQLNRIRLKNGEAISIIPHTTEIYFVFKGSVIASDNVVDLPLHKGDAMLAIPGNKLSFLTKEESVIFRATVPYSHE